MKKIIILISLLILAKFEFIICQSTPAKINLPLIFKETATWCRYCGSWGWELQDSIEKIYKDKALVVSLHVNNSDFQTTTTKAWHDNFSMSNSIPCWYANGIDQTKWNEGNVYEYKIKNNIKKEVDNFNSSPIIANSNFIFKFNRDSISITSSVKFFQNTTGEYYLGVYLFEDSILYKQTTLNGDEIKIHNNILRYSLSNTPFGSLIFSGSIKSNALYMQQFSNLFIDPKKVNSKYSYLASILWKKVNGKYYFVNSYKLSGYIKSNISKIFENNKRINNVNIISTSHSKYVSLDLNSTYNNDNIYISIFNINGEKVKHEKINNLGSDKCIYEIDSSSLPDGIYFIKINIGIEDYNFKVYIFN